jgi:RHS repeat-associated protein
MRRNHDATGLGSSRIRLRFRYRLLISAIAASLVLTVGAIVPAQSSTTSAVLHAVDTAQVASSTANAPNTSPVVTSPVNVTSGHSPVVPGSEASKTLIHDGAAFTPVDPDSHGPAPSSGTGGASPDGLPPTAPVTSYPSPKWNLQYPENVPDERVSAPMTLDTSANVDLMFGGEDSDNTYLSSTYEWNGSNWSANLSGSTHPSARVGAVMAYDPSINKTILYGGYNGTSLLSDTWEWSSSTSTWTQLSPSTSPGNLAFASLAYDPSTGNLVLFGGATSTGDSPGFGGGSSAPSESSKTWTFNGTNWTQLSPTTSPPARDDASMAYDTSESDMVLFGGFSATGTYLDDTWTFNGTTWTEQSPYASPPALAMQTNAMAYDSVLGRIIMFGGTDSSGDNTDGTYVWDQQTGTWATMNPTDSANNESGASIAPAAVNGQILLFGGYDTDYDFVWQSTLIFDWLLTGNNTGDPTYSVPVDDQASAVVDLATGNLRVDQQGLNYAGTGLNLATGSGEDTLTTFWEDYPQSGGLFALPDGSMDVELLNNSWDSYDFEYRSGAFVSPPGINATLTYNSGPDTYTLTYNQSQVKETFDAPSYGDLGPLVSITDRNGDSITVNAGFWSGSYVDTRGRTTSWSFDDSDLETITGPDGRTVTEQWDPSASYVESITDAAGKTTYFYYNSSNEIDEIVTPNGNEVLFGYYYIWVDSITQVTNFGAGTGPTATFTYQAVPSGTTVTTGTPQQETVVENPNGDDTDYFTAYNGQALKVVDANGNSVSTSYSVARNPENLINGLTYQSTLAYGANNLVNQITAPPTSSGQSAVNDYASYATPNTVTGYADLPSSSLDGEGSCTAYTYDTAGNITATYSGLAATSGTTNCDGKSTGTGVSALTNAYQGDGSTTCGGKTGELCTQTSGNGNTTTYGYDSSGELTSVTAPGGSCTGTRKLCTSYSYQSNNSRVATVTDGKDQVTTYSYDGDNRVTQILYNGASSCVYSSGNCVTFTYDGDGNVLTREDKTGTTTFVYDDLNRLVKEELPSGANACSGLSPAGITYGYDSASNLTSYCDAGGTVTYAYDPANRVLGVATGSGSCASGDIVQPCTQYGYNNANELTSITYPTSTGVVDTIGYDQAGDETSTVVAKSGTDLEDLGYTFWQSTTDKPLRQSVDNMLSGVTTSYSYDAHDRLTGASTGTGSTSQSYGYDLDSNLTTEDLGGTTTTLAYNADDQLCWAYAGTSSNTCSAAPTGSTTYAYDADGNQASSSAGESLSYNPLNQTTSMTPAGGSALSMAYAGVDSTQRTSVGSTTLTNNVFGVASSTTSGTSTYFTRDPGGNLNSVLVGATRYYVFYDGAGSVAGLINSSGTQVGSYSYDPYGNTTATGTDASVDPYRFQGGYEDTSGFYKFGTRYENPALGTWTQEDPASVNYLEGYVFDGADPVNNVDSGGTCILDFGSGCPINNIFNEAVCSLKALPDLQGGVEAATAAIAIGLLVADGPQAAVGLAAVSPTLAILGAAAGAEFYTFYKEIASCV